MEAESKIVNELTFGVCLWQKFDIVLFLQELFEFIRIINSSVVYESDAVVLICVWMSILVGFPAMRSPPCVSNACYVANVFICLSAHYTTSGKKLER